MRDDGDFALGDGVVAAGVIQVPMRIEQNMNAGVPDLLRDELQQRLCARR